MSPDGHQGSNRLAISCDDCGTSLLGGSEKLRKLIPCCFRPYAYHRGRPLAPRQSTAVYRRRQRDHRSAHLPVLADDRHCEERSDEAILRSLNCFASLEMTHREGTLRNSAIARAGEREERTLEIRRAGLGDQRGRWRVAQHRAAVEHHDP